MKPTIEDPCERETPTVPIDSFSLYRKQALELRDELQTAAIIFEKRIELLDIKAMCDARERAGKAEEWRLFFAGAEYPPTSPGNRTQAIEEFLIYKQTCRYWLAGFNLPTRRPERGET